MTLKEAMTQDLDGIFFNEDEFATSISVLPSAAPSYTILAQVFDDEDEEIEGTLVAVWAKASDLQGINKDWKFEWNTTVMDVVDFRLDEFNDVLKLFLNRRRKL
jgi:hypothetical protein